MKTVKNSTLLPRVVTDAGEIERLRWFQQHRYFEAGLLSSMSHSLPNDPIVAHSTYFGVYDGEDIAATARVVCIEDLPLFDHHAIDPEFQYRLDAAQGHVGEISRLAVEQSTGHYVALALLAREFLRFGLSSPQASLLVASVEQPLVRMLGQVLGVPLHVIGDEIASYGNYNGACLPILIDTAECMRAFMAKDCRQHEFFTEDLVIDLTAETPQHSFAN